MYQFCVEYGQKGACVIGNEASLEKALSEKDRYVAYYTEIGHTIHEATIVRICDTCVGHGVTYCKHKGHNRYGCTAFVPEKCRKVCRACRGEKTFPVELPPQEHPPCTE
jgi:hypothetical protein